MKEILIICFLILVIKLAKAQFVITNDTNNYFKTQLDSINNQESIETVNSFISDNNIPIQQFIISAKRDTILNSKNALYWIKANSFKDENNKIVNDSITLDIKEYFSKSDFVLANLSTQTSDSKPLKSAGMFSINAQKNNIGLQLINNKGIHVKILDNAINSKMHIFRSNDNGKTWLQTKDSIKFVSKNSANKRTTLVYNLKGYKLNSTNAKNERWFSSDKSINDSLELELIQKTFQINNITFFNYEYKILKENKNFAIKRINNQDYIQLKANQKYKHIGILQNDDFNEKVLWNINLVNILPKANELSQDIGSAKQFKFTLYLKTIIGQFDHICPADTIKTVEEFKQANPDLNAYLLKINNLGFYNLDSFYEKDSLNSSLTIQAPIGSVIRLIFNKNRTVLVSKTNNQGLAYFNQLPQNINMNMMCTYVEEDKILTHFSKVGTFEKFSEMNISKEKFEGLDIKQIEVVLKEM